MYTSIAVLNEETFKGMVANTKGLDILLFVAALLPTAAIPLIGKQEFEKYSPSWHLILAGGILTIAAWTWLGRYIQKLDSESDSDSDSQIPFTELISNMWMWDCNGWKFYYEKFNFTGYIIKCMTYGPTFNSTISDKDKLWIKNTLENKNKFENEIISDQKSDDTRKLENLIFIVVESLPARLIESEDAPLILPYLTNLIENDKSVYVPCLDITGPGHSSDGQFIYNTGLLPLRNEVLVLKYALKDYPSLAKALNIYSLEIIGESKSIWNHKETSQSYGFNQLIDNIATGSRAVQDSLIFEEGKRQLEKLSSPFFMLLTTLSMHSPYDWAETPHFLSSLDLKTQDVREIEYLNRAHDFDRQLGRFIENLKRLDKYSNTLIVIAGDHVIHGDDINWLKDDRVPFILVNSPLKEPKGNAFTQADVFPTIMQIFKLNYRYKGWEYRGVGESIFFENKEKLSERDYKVSELIITGDL